jgi:hypothetical protein
LSSYLPLITGSGGALVVMAIGLWLFLAGQIVPKGTYDEMREQRDEWKRASELNAARAEAGTAAGQVVKDVMLSLRKELE